MSVVFFFVVTPIAIIAKIFGKDFLKLKKKENEKKKSYWITKEKYDNSMKDQF
jgi:NADH:ubiquinone oxidoreductase subunit 3 (subunit A)